MRQSDRFLPLSPTGRAVPIATPSSTPGVAATPVPRLALPDLESTVSGYLAQALAPSTLRTYQSGQRRFLRFCTDADLQPLTLSENLLCLFVAHLASQGLVPQTIKAYLSAIRFFHIMAGHGDPFAPGALPRLQYVVRGIKRAPRSPSRPRLPLTPPLLQAIKTCWAPKAADADTVMLWAACCMGFFGFMCAGEFTVTSAQNVEQETCLSAQDVAVDSHASPSIVRVHLKQSKTDPFRHGVDIFLGRTDAALCPVAAILAYCAIRPAIASPFFVFEDGSPLTRERLVAAVRSALSHAGVNTAHYSGHSFRVVAATRAGLQEATIKMLGRWESSAYERYVRMPRESLAAISRQLSRGC